MKRPPEKDNSERWLLPYSDLMNLLLILFIILYSMSKVDVQKATQVAESIRKGFNASQAGVQQSPVSQNTTSRGLGNTSSPTASTAASQDWSALYNEVTAIVAKSGQQQNVGLSSDSSGLVITLKDNTLYASGSANMNPNGANLVDQIGDALKPVGYAFVIVEGHTDSDPIRNSSYKDNLDLSTARAANVERALIARGLDSKRMGAMGRGDTVPVAPNDNEVDKAKNRRVVITVFKSLKNLTADQFITFDELDSAMQ